MGCGGGGGGGGGGLGRKKKHFGFGHFGAGVVLSVHFCPGFLHLHFLDVLSLEVLNLGELLSRHSGHSFALWGKMPLTPDDQNLGLWLTD